VSCGKWSCVVCCELYCDAFGVIMRGPESGNEVEAAITMVTSGGDAELVS
jgi:hypothetical protein